MSGFVKNEWESYLNGKSSQYNFTYRNKQEVEEAIPSTAVASSVMPSTMPSPSIPNKMAINDTKNINKVNISKKGGHKKYTRKYRKSARKSVRK